MYGVVAQIPFLAKDAKDARRDARVEPRSHGWNVLCVSLFVKKTYLIHFPHARLPHPLATYLLKRTYNHAPTNAPRSPFTNYVLTRVQKTGRVSGFGGLASGKLLTYPHLLPRIDMLLAGSPHRQLYAHLPYLLLRRWQQQLVREDGQHSAGVG